MPTIVGILTFMSRKISVSAEHENSFITLRPGPGSLKNEDRFSHGMVYIFATIEEQA